MNKALSIIIVSWNCRALLEDCLTSIRASDYPAHDLEVFVVDNASSDGTVPFVAARFPDIRLITNSENRGFAAANNQAIAACSGRMVLLLNPDTVVSPDALRLMTAAMERDPTIGMLGARLVSPDGSYQRTSARKLPNALTSLLRLVAYDRYAERHGWPFPGYPDDRRDKDVEAISGACMLIRREILDRLGNLDADLPMAAEDIDYCKRLRDQGVRIVALGTPVIVHVHGGSRALAVGRTDVQGYLAIHAYFRKHGETGRALFYRCALAIAMGLRFFFWQLLGLVKPRSAAVFREKARASLRLVGWALVGRQP